MSKLKVRGRLTHIPGPWGAAVPGGGYGVKIIDLHPIRNTRQTIWTGTANAQGVFQGETEDWRDRVVLIPAQPARRLFPGGPTIPGAPAVHGPDPTDILMLLIEITAGGQTHQFPFPFIADNIEIPVILPFAPAGFVAVLNQATVNGATFTDPAAMQAAIVSIATGGASEIRIGLRGTFAAHAAPLIALLTQSPQQLRANSLSPAFGGPMMAAAVPPPVPPEVLIILAIAILVLAVGSSVVLVCLGVAVILALVLGYAEITAGCTPSVTFDGSANDCQIVLRK